MELINFLKNQLNSLPKAIVILLSFLWWALTFSSALSEIAFFAALILWMIWKVRDNRFFTGQMPLSLLWLFLGFVVLSLFSHFWSEFPDQSFRGVFKLMQHVTLFCMVLDTFDSKESIRKFQWVFLIVAAVTCLNGFWQYYFGADFLRGIASQDASAGTRISASFKSYGHLGVYMAMIIPPLVGYIGVIKARTQSKALLILSCLCLIGCLTALFLTRSRGAFLGLLAGCLAFIILRKKMLWLLLLTVLVGGSFFVLPKSMIIHLDADMKEQSIVERYYLWDRAIHVIKAKPLTGTGINTYDVAHPKYDKTQNWRVKGYYAHNGYLQMAAETGLPALLLFLAFLFWYSILSFRHERALFKRHEQNLIMSFMIGMISFLAIAAVDTVMHNPQPIMIVWYLLGIQWAHQRVLRQQSV